MPSADPSGFAEELIPADFVPVRLPTAVQTARRILFGAAPDRAMINYRTRQLLEIVASTELAHFVTELDPRVTHLDPQFDLMDPAAFAPRVVQASGPVADLIVLGRPEAPDTTGIMTHAYLVDVLSSATIQVRRDVEPIRLSVYDLTLDGGSYIPVPLFGSGYTARTPSNNPGDLWSVEIRNRPQRDPGELTATLASIGEPALLAILGVHKTEEPYATLRAIWHSTRETPLRLAAFIVALVYRTEEAHRG